MNRRQLIKLSCGSLTSLIAIQACSPGHKELARKVTVERPNILWISAEDISPDLGCYGDDYAITPNIDAFAKQAVRFDNAFTSAGVCSPVRSGIITGMYANSIGTCPMRCDGVPPASVKCFTEYLRQSGYYCSNNSKTDYQFNTPASAWDDSSDTAHWRNRPVGKPFFSVFNYLTTHEGRIRRPPGRKAELHNPKRAKVPPYYPDTPVVRNDIACYADNITTFDKQFRDLLEQLKCDGLHDDTIVWVWGDHGRGLPRCKRWLYDSSTRMPLLIYYPPKYRHLAGLDTKVNNAGQQTVDAMISSIDFGPTVLSLAGVNSPSHMQGRAFAGINPAKPRKYIYGARDRIDEAQDIVRMVFDGRYRYIRNFMPHIPYSVDVKYMNAMPTMQEMRRLHEFGKLKGPQKQYFKHPRYIEELYDTKKDPHEVNNLAFEPSLKNKLQHLRNKLHSWMLEISDVGLIPEPEFDRLKRPGDIWLKVPSPGVRSIRAREDQEAVKLECELDGASIVYVIDSGDAEDKPRQQLYYAPIILKTGQVLEAIAVRPGFEDSEEVVYEIQSPDITAQPANIPYSHWAEEISASQIKRLIEVKSLEIDAGYNKSKWLEALNDKYGSARYWAVIHFHHRVPTVAVCEPVSSRLVEMLNDSCPSVRIVAAEAVTDLNLDKHGLNVLKHYLNNGIGTERLWAAWSLKRLGTKALPLLEEVKSVTDDDYFYLNRDTTYYIKAVCENLLKEMNA